MRIINRFQTNLHFVVKFDNYREYRLLKPSFILARPDAWRLELIRNGNSKFAELSRENGWKLLSLWNFVNHEK